MLSARVFHYLENTTVSSPHASVLTAINIVRCKLLPFDCHENLSLPSGPLRGDARVARLFSNSNFTSIVLKLYPTTITQYIIRDSSVLVISLVVVANSAVSFVPRSLLVNSFMASRVSGLILFVSS